VAVEPFQLGKEIDRMRSIGVADARLMLRHLAILRPTREALRPAL
jgi:hypothetical protein